MTVHQALKASTRAWQAARLIDGKRREIIAMKKICGTKATGLHEDLRVVVDASDPTTKRKLTAAELASADWQPVMKQREWQ